MATQYQGYVRPGRADRWQDGANVVLAIWLFISPWVLRFVATAQATGNAANGPAVAASHAAWNAWVLGVIVFLIAVSAIGNLEIWQEWWSIILGAWIFAAPWALGFTGLVRASWDHWIVGALIFIFDVWSLSRLWNAPASTLPPPAVNRPPRGPVV
jgi:SPW repeat